MCFNENNKNRKVVIVIFVFMRRDISRAYRPILNDNRIALLEIMLLHLKLNPYIVSPK